MIIIGLPGIGKSELLKNSLNKIQAKYASLNVISPFFPSFIGEAGWGFEDIVMSILEELQPGICVTKHRVAVLHKILTNLKEPTLLVLEIAYINIKQDAIVAFWSFMDRLLRTDNSNLKVIATSCKTPELSQLRHLQVEELHLKGLDKSNVFALLRYMNPTIKDEYCEKIYQFCGGNPFILRKLGAHIENSTEPEKEVKDLISVLGSSCEVDYLQPFMRKTILKRDMKIVFDELETEERIALVKLCCFYGKITVDDIVGIFENDVVTTAKHLWRNHCILEKSKCGTYFLMNEITRTFIQDYALGDKILSRVLFESKSMLIKHYLKMLRELDDVFFGPYHLNKYHLCLFLVQKYREECKMCTTNCSCAVPQVLKFLLQKHKAMIMRSIKSGLNDEHLFDETFRTCSKAVHFLRNVVPYSELHEIFDLIFEKSSLLNLKTRMAVTMANLVFIKIYHKVCAEKDENISYLTKAINYLEKQKPCLSHDFLEMLAYCYVNRGYLRGFYSFQVQQGMKDVKAAQLILSSLATSPRLEIAKLSTYGYMAGVLKICSLLYLNQYV